MGHAKKSKRSASFLLKCRHFLPRYISMPKEQALEKFLAKYTPAMAANGRRALAKMRRLVPGAVEMIYDNYNGLVIGFGPTPRASEAIFSIVLYPRYMNLFFLQGATVPDPGRRLQGNGKVVRYIRLDDAAVLDQPEVRQLIERALYHAKVAMDPKGKRQTIVKAVAAKQRPRRAKS